MNRPSWDDYFMELCEVIAKRSTCLRRQNGALAVKDRRIIATGYNGHMVEAPHCKTCLREELKIPSGYRHELCKAIHSEANAVIQCAKYGIRMEGSTLYTTLKPCSMCFKMLANVGVAKIVYKEEYPDEMVDNLIKDANFVVIREDDYFYLQKVKGL